MFNDGSERCSVVKVMKQCGQGIAQGDVKSIYNNPILLSYLATLSITGNQFFKAGLSTTSSNLLLAAGAAAVSSGGQVLFSADQWEDMEKYRK